MAERGTRLSDLAVQIESNTYAINALRERLRQYEREIGLAVDNVEAMAQQINTRMVDGHAYARRANTAYERVYDWYFGVRPDSLDAALGYPDRAREREQAQVRARELLLSVLNPIQRNQMERYEHFAVAGSDGSMWVVDPRHAWEVSGLGAKMQIRHHCVVFRNVLIPNDDMAVARKMMIESDAGNFRRQAISTDSYPVYESRRDLFTRLIRQISPRKPKPWWKRFIPFGSQ